MRATSRLPLLSFYLLAFALMLILHIGAWAQETDEKRNEQTATLYSARGFWLELNNPTYRKLIKKQENGHQLTSAELTYIKDYKEFLDKYYSRMSVDEHARFELMKENWDIQIVTGDDVETEFEWRARDRAINSAYGIYYGATIAVLAESQSAASLGLPLLTGGLWMLGPSILPRKYEDMDRSILALSNAGKFYGLLNGGALGVAVINSDSDGFGKGVMLLSSIGSIAMGEAGFHYQRRNHLSRGHIDLLSHYSVLGNGIGLASTIASSSESSNVYGAAVLAGGITGLFLGDFEAGRYDYTKGDVQAVSTLSLASAGIGAAISAQIIDNYYSSSGYESGNPEWSALIPAATALGSTFWAQRQVRNARLTRRQGSMIALSSAGAALGGLGIAVMTESSSPAVYIGIPSAFALVTEQIVFNNFKKQNLAAFQKEILGKEPMSSLYLKVSPENFLLNESMDFDDHFRGGVFNEPASVVKLGLRF